MNKWKYKPYYGPDDFIFIRVHKNDEKLGLQIAEKLLQKKIRIFFDVVDQAIPEDVAAGILNCDKAIFILSKDACDNLDMRNAINYAFKEKKKIICIKDGNFVPTHGLDMQLANVEMIETMDADRVVTELENRNVLSGNLVGEGLVYKEDNKKKKLSIMILLASLFLFLVVSVFFIKNRLNYLNSAEYLLKDVDGSEYLDISNFDETALKALEGMSIKTLNMDSMNIKDISDIVNINVEEVIISHNPNVITLWHLNECKGLRSVTVSEDMLRFVRDLLGKDFEVKVVK